MNMIAQLLEHSKHNDGILPEYDQELMSNIISGLDPASFDWLMADMKKAALAHDIFSKKGKTIRDGADNGNIG